MSANDSPVAIRDATGADLSDLAAIRPPQAVHRGRLRDAQRSDFRYFVITQAQEIVGFACLVFHRPHSWSDPDDTRYLPQIVDLHIAEQQRGQGYGSEAIGIIERITAEAGHQHLYIAVEPLDNPRAHMLYQRLGYQALYTEPRLQTWTSTDGDNQIQRGEAWLIHMVKRFD